LDKLFSKEPKDEASNQGSKLEIKKNYEYRPESSAGDRLTRNSTA
jgi:hypothetical protein